MTRCSSSTCRRVEPSLAGPNRPEQRVSLAGLRGSFERVFPQATPTAAEAANGRSLADGDIVLAAITSCTNTANPSAMLPPACSRATSQGWAWSRSHG